MKYITKNRKASLPFPLLLGLLLISCGGGGGGSPSASAPTIPNIAPPTGTAPSTSTRLIVPPPSVNDALTTTLGVRDVSVVPAPAALEVSWINPESPSKLIREYRLNLIGWTAKKGGSQVRGGDITVSVRSAGGSIAPRNSLSPRNRITPPVIIPYNGDSLPNHYIFSNLNSSLYYELSMQSVYGDNDTSSEVGMLADENKRRLLGKDSDRDGFADKEDLDDDGDGIADRQDNCPMVANRNQANSDSGPLGDACDTHLRGSSFFAQKITAKPGPASFNVTWDNPLLPDGFSVKGANIIYGTWNGWDNNPVVELNTTVIFTNRLLAARSYTVAGLHPKKEYRVAVQLYFDYKNPGGGTSTLISGEGIILFADRTGGDDKGGYISVTTLPASPMVDEDNDSIPDSIDNCRGIPNRGQADSDGDFIGDDCDPIDNRVDGDEDGILNSADNCPTVANLPQADSDGDSFGDACDVDDDNDGLVEIATAEEFNAIRYALADTLPRRVINGTVNGTAVKLDLSCTSQTDRASCHGYELIADISLADYNYWQPIGNECNYLGYRYNCHGSSFDAIFEGNGHTISDISILWAYARTHKGIGLFGTSEYGSFNNLTLNNVNIALPNFSYSAVGALVGYTQDVDVSSVSVKNLNIDASHHNRVGGLVGSGSKTKVKNSSVIANAIRGDTYVGGLVGSGGYIVISSSYVIAETVAGRGGKVGGLVGSGYPEVEIHSSSVMVNTISGPSAGGLVGYSRLGGRIFYSSAVVETIVGSAGVGGLVGDGDNTIIGASLSLVGYLKSRNNQVGGIVGHSSYSYPIRIANTYWLSSVGFPNNQPAYRNTFGESKNAAELLAPTSFEGSIYTSWANAWCDPATGEFTGEASHPLATTDSGDTYRAWDLGTDSEFPVLTCFGDRLSLAKQRQTIREIIALDDDGDNVPNSIDNCPLRPNPDQANADGDQFGDVCDNLDNRFDPDGDSIEDSSDNCPSIANPDQTDTDRDGYGNVCDVDDDGDGLIEIATAKEFSAIRYNLEGTSFKETHEATGNAIGCGGQGNKAICGGYELTADISLSQYSNWNPIGGCAIEIVRSLDPRVPPIKYSVCIDIFNTKFDGNGHAISNVTIDLRHEIFGVGLFGAAGKKASFHDIRLRDVEITADEQYGKHFGSLVGSAKESNLSSIVADGIRIDAPAVRFVGGLVGYGLGVNIFTSAVIADRIRGGHNVGGLIGYGEGVISYSSVIADEILGDSGYYVGGLVSDWSGGDIFYSYAVADVVAGWGFAGGLIGEAYGASIRSSLALVKNINSSFLEAGGIVGSSGLIVDGPDNPGPKVVESTYWQDGVKFRSEGPIYINTLGENKTALELQGPTAFTNNIYTSWANAWCNSATGEYTDDVTHVLATTGGGDTHRAWDLGNAFEYPVISCFGDRLTPNQQRTAIDKVLAGESPLPLSAP